MNGQIVARPHVAHLTCHPVDDSVEDSDEQIRVRRGHQQLVNLKSGIARRPVFSGLGQEKGSGNGHIQGCMDTLT